MKIIYWIAGTGFLLSAMALDSESMTPAWICAGCAALLAGAAVGRWLGEKLERQKEKKLKVGDSE